MKCVTALCWELHRHKTLYSVSTICSSNGSSSVGWWHKLHQVMPRVCDSVDPGSPLCDKAQWLCRCQGWRWCPAELRDYGLESARLPVCVGRERRSRHQAGRPGLAPCWITVCRKTDHFLPLNSLLQCFEPEPIQSTWCWFFCLLLSETILDKSLFGKLKPF